MEALLLLAVFALIWLVGLVTAVWVVPALIVAGLVRSAAARPDRA